MGEGVFSLLRFHRERAKAFLVLISSSCNDIMTQSHAHTYSRVCVRGDDSLDLAEFLPNVEALQFLGHDGLFFGKWVGCATALFGLVHGCSFEGGEPLSI